MDVYEYFHSRERECSELSLAPDTSFADMCAEQEGSGGQLGIFFGRLILSDRAFLQVFEFIEVEGSGIHRIAYSYYLVVDEAEVWGYDRAPDHDPPDHMHIGPGHERFPSASVTFKDIAEKAWATLSAEEALEDTDALSDDPPAPH